MRKNIAGAGAIAASLIVLAGAVMASRGASADDMRMPSRSEGKGTVTYQRPTVGRGVSSAVSVPILSEESTTFRAVPPCRIVNTNLSSEGAIVKNTTRDFFAIFDVFGFPDQGGTSGNCGIPNTATAVLMNVTAASPQGSGNLRAWAWSGDQPSASLVNFTKGVNIANAATVEICRNELNSGGLCSYDFSVRASNATTHVVIDVMGYYEGPIAANVYADGSLAAASLALESIEKNFAGDYLLTFDRDVSSCAVEATLSTHSTGFVTGEVSVGRALTSDFAVWVYTSNSAGSAADLPFTVVVNC